MGRAEPWLFKAPAVPSSALVAAVGGHPWVAQLLAQRGVDTPEKAIPFLDPGQYQPAPPSALLGVDAAAALILAAVQQRQHLLVWGDFDVDGQTSTALLVTALRTLAGDDRVRFHVPNRFEENHGIRLHKLQEKQREGPLDLLLTCDTGIAEAEAIGYARDQQIVVVVTDHHDLPAEFQGLLPDRLWGREAAEAGSISVRRANAIVNPKFLPEGDPLRTLPGVGVAYKLVQRLFALAGRSGEEERLLDLVALGIVADVAEQVNDARYLLQRGLERLRTTTRVGLLALMQISQVDASQLTAESIGFQLGPRMNALGRLEDATVAVELLSTRDPIRAGQLANQLERLNQERRRLTSQIASSADTLIEHDPSLLEFNALVLAHPAWHAGVVGIVASRLVELYGKPVVLLRTPAGELARGSARSVQGVDIGAAIAACSHLLAAHGGHPGAAGLSLKPENIAAFRQELSHQVELHRDPVAQPGLQIDLTVRLDELSLEVASQLARLAPFGQGNPLPRLATGGVVVVGDRRMGAEGTHRKLRIRQGEGPVLEMLWFGGGGCRVAGRAAGSGLYAGGQPISGRALVTAALCGPPPGRHPACGACCAATACGPGRPAPVVRASLCFAGEGNLVCGRNPSGNSWCRGRVCPTLCGAGRAFSPVGSVEHSPFSGADALALGQQRQRPGLSLCPFYRRRRAGCRAPAGGGDGQICVEPECGAG
ncbi:MAG: single-stranded-DNA-specific exonuclease RecJ [Caldilinea sp.]